MPNSKSKTKTKKRKLRDNDDGDNSSSRPSRAHREDDAETDPKSPNNQSRESSCPTWMINLQLASSLQSKDIDNLKKVELAFRFVKSRVGGGTSGIEEDCQTVKMPRLVVFLNDWIQSLLIASEKWVKFGGGKRVDEVSGTCLDAKCWEIFKFGLEESLKLNVPLTFTRNLLLPICCIGRSVISLLDDASSGSKELCFCGDGFELYNIFLDCLKLLFISHNGLSNQNLDLWISTVDVVLELVLKAYSENLEGVSAGSFVLHFLCLIFEPFSKFLRVHPARKNGFRDFVDKLLEPLLELFGVLRRHIDGENHICVRNSLELAEEVLCQGLFHPVHIDGFLNLRTTEKYVTQDDGKLDNLKVVIKSYHRHLFDKLELLMNAKKESALDSVGMLFHLLIDRVQRPKGVSMASEDMKMPGKTESSTLTAGDVHVDLFKSSGISSKLPEKNNHSSSLNAESRKSLFDFFVQIMDPLLLRISCHLDSKVEPGPQLLFVNCMFRSVNSLLASLMQGKVYARTEDVSKGACFNFLRKVQEITVSVARHSLSFSEYVIDKRMHAGKLILLGKQLLDAIGYILEVEYEVLGNDIVSVWLVMLSFLAVDHSAMDAGDKSHLASKVQDLGCQLINIYSELRQVNNTIFALCKAIRLTVSHDRTGAEMSYAKLMPSASLFHKSYVKSVGILLGSQEFKIAIFNAIKCTPEGQASECIQQLTLDISESLEWLKDSLKVEAGNQLSELNGKGCNMLILDLQAELLGRGLSQIYTLLLDSATVPTSNNKLQDSINDLMAVICPFMTSLVDLQPETVDEFLFSVTRTSEKKIAGDKCGVLYQGDSAWWVVVFFFRLYMSCRSLNRQALSLMPPDTSKKSALMWDSFTAHCGNDWVQKTDWVSEGYFSWVLRPSTSLLLVIKSVTTIYLQDQIGHHGPLVYALHHMALQRLVDLNRHIKSLEYLFGHYENLVKVKLVDDINLNGRIDEMKQEAEGLTRYIMGHLQYVAEHLQLISISDDTISNELFPQTQSVGDEWDFDVYSTNEKSLPTAIWWILCQNTDVWCSHATKKDLKMFLSLLIQSSLTHVTSSTLEFGKHKTNGELSKVTLHYISSELISDSIFFEHRFVRRYVASTFCNILEKLIFQIFGHSLSGNVSFNSSSDWSEVMNKLDKRSGDILDKGHDAYDCLVREKSVSHSSDVVLMESREEQEPLSFNGSNFLACKSLLNFLFQMPKGHLSAMSFSLCTTHVLNLERHVVSYLIDCQGTLFSHQHLWLLKLLVSCRKALNPLMMKFFEGNGETLQKSAGPVLEGQFPVSWIFKSVFVLAGLKWMHSGVCGNQIKDLMFTLMDHTSYVILTLYKYHSRLALAFIQSAREPGEDKPDHSQDHPDFTESGLWLKLSYEEINGLNSLLCIAQSLKQEMSSLSLYIKDTLDNERERSSLRTVTLNKLSSSVSCFSGLLCGISSAVNDMDATSNGRSELLEGKDGLIQNLNLCIDVFSGICILFLRILLWEDSPQCKSLPESQSLPVGDSTYFLLGVNGFQLEDSNEKADESCGKYKKELEDGLTSVALSNDKSPKDAAVSKHRKRLGSASFAGRAVAEIDVNELHKINKLFLRSLLEGHDPEAAFSLRQVFTATASVLRLKSQISGLSFKSNLVPVCTGISQVILLEFVEMDSIPQSFSFVWLDGVLKYLEELGCLFASTDPTLSRSLYSKLIRLHLKAIGKCSSLQGKRAVLASHETVSNIKTIHGHLEFLELSTSYGPYCLDEFKARLRTSFKIFIREPMELHLLSAIQTIERALVGVEDGFTSTYKIYTGGIKGGEVAPVVAAGIDCLDLLLEHVSGRKRLNVLKRHIHSLIASLFNIVLHLQGPSIFFQNSNNMYPDPGAVILMCVEVLTRVAGKHALYQMESWHVTQSLRIPGALFRNHHQLGLLGIPIPLYLLTCSCNQECGPETATNLSAVDNQFSIELYAACCRLLYTVVKHHKSASEQYVAVLQDSVSVLLNCLEIVSSDPVGNIHFWKVEEGVKCACFLRRIYEELRQQKDVFGQHCFKFLSHYIWVHSGYGSLKAGFRREVDEALRPGIYAMIEACSVDDLQHLHTLFGEGPCRHTLSNLQHDYKQNFQYEGKV